MSINRNEITKEMIEKAQQCKTADEAEYTWRDVDRGASAIAAELYTLGAGPGSQVALIRRKFHCHCCHRLVYYYIGGYRGGTEWIKI